MTFCGPMMKPLSLLGPHSTTASVKPGEARIASMTIPLGPQNSTILSPRGTMVASPPLLPGLVVRWEPQLPPSTHPLQTAFLQSRHQASLSWPCWSHLAGQTVLGIVNFLSVT